MYRILIVEDDPVICRELCRHLEKWDYEVRSVKDFRAVVDEASTFDPHLVLMDVVLPFFNGFHWCAELRRQSRVPVMFLSSASDNMNIVLAMNMGGDDFIAKPFDLNVLTAKVQALLRRTYDFSSQAASLSHGDVSLSLGDTLAACGDKTAELTKNEYRILRTLMEHAGQVVSRESLMEVLWDSDSYIDDNTLTVNVTRLRKKLEEAGVTDYIVTRKGMGYLVP